MEENEVIQETPLCFNTLNDWDLAQPSVLWNQLNHLGLLIHGKFKTLSTQEAYKGL